MLPSATLASLAARADASLVAATVRNGEALVRWTVPTARVAPGGAGVLRVVSRVRAGEPVLHLAELAGALRSPFAFASRGEFESPDEELLSWLEFHPSGRRLAPFAGAPVPWLVQARPRGTLSRVAFLDPTTAIFEPALLVFGAVAALFPAASRGLEQPFLCNGADLDLVFERGEELAMGAPWGMPLDAALLGSAEALDGRPV